MRRREWPTDLPAGDDSGPCPRYLLGSGHAYAKQIGLDWPTQWAEVRRRLRAAKLAWFAERGLVDERGWIDFRRANALG